jgi:hypothetical protein
LLKKLLKGKYKIRVGIYLDEKSPPIISFARFIWTNYDPKNKDFEGTIKCGLNLIEIPPSRFFELEEFINNNIDKIKKY